MLSFFFFFLSCLFLSSPSKATKYPGQLIRYQFSGFIQNVWRSFDCCWHVSASLKVFNTGVPTKVFTWWCPRKFLHRAAWTQLWLDPLCPPCEAHSSNLSRFSLLFIAPHPFLFSFSTSVWQGIIAVLLWPGFSSLVCVLPAGFSEHSEVIQQTNKW